MPGYNSTVYEGDLVRVSKKFAEKARKETDGNYINTAYYNSLEEQRREKERARRVTEQSRFFAQHGTRDGEEEVDDEKHKRNLTELQRSRGIFTKATTEEQQAAILYMSRRRDAKAKQEKAEYLAEQSRRWNEEERMKEEKEKLKKAKPFLARVANKVANKVAKTVANGLDLDYNRGGGGKSKEILGKIRRIYKVAGSRKEHVKYKGELIPVSDYKKLMKLKR